ncbi:MAG: acyl-CoA dehydrogenase family protein [Alphaproteobacteria bacterium]|jgi:pimeloyl-CoA dehydrogenase small subunit|nr:acyl-CoA dehydrogenase family protein [Alphaproteobacteria bacterium]MBN9566405.1 acyl-CoA dehydrogenase family protein [Alphaproteobacteria bacterium]OJU55691.1 MAG: pimeloyl-CoA dehydrogenase small subunit [Alphaproteobacteria bacterium 62-8]
MDFNFSEEQTLLRNSVSKYLADNYAYENWRKFTRTEAGRDPKHWAQFAELGLFAAPLPEAYGGLGGGAVDTMVIMEEFGRTLVVEPYVPTVVIGGGLLARAGSDALKEEFLNKIAAGETIMAFAFAEAQSRFNLANVSTTAKKQGGNYVLNGSKAVVLSAPIADTLIVTARTAGNQRDQKGVSVFLVDKNAKGIATRDYATVDGLRASEIHFENVEVPAARLIGTADDGYALVERAVDEAIAAHCAEATGAMKVLVDTTVEYSKTRKQFGVPIGKFQALQHRMVDMFINYEQSVSMTLMVTLKLGESDGERAKAASAAKVQIGKAGRSVGQEAVQIHGGIGMTEELNVGHYFKRLTMLDTLYGNVDHHLQRYAAQS